jgi:hypothetical protein
MKPSLARVRVLATSGIPMPPCALPALLAERPSNAGHLLFWLLCLKMARDQRGPSKVDINSATVKDVRSVPRIERREPLEITAHRPYGGLPDLIRAPLFPRLSERLTASLPVPPYSPSAHRLVRRGRRGAPLWRYSESAG